MTDEPRPALLMSDMIQSLTQASGACSQLIHSLPSPNFIFIREMVEGAKMATTTMATFEAKRTLYVN